MSSSADVLRPRPAAVRRGGRGRSLAAFLAIVAVVAMVLVNANGESLAEQIPYVIAFAMFGVVGALIVSRDRRNTIGLLFLWASFLTASSFLCGEVFTCAVVHGQSGWWLAVIGLLNNFGWLFGILPVVFLTPLLFPDGHLPSPRWRPFLWFIVAFLVVIGIDLALGPGDVDGLDRGDRDREPVVRRGRRAAPHARSGDRRPVPGDLRGLGRVAHPPVPSFDGRGATADQVGGVRVWWWRSSGSPRPPSSSHETIVTALIGGIAFLLLPALDRDRDPAVPPLRPGRRRAQDLDLRRVRALRHARSTSRLVVGVGVWLGRDNSFLTMVAAVVVALTFQPARARLTRFANRLVYGKRATPYEVLSEFSERVGGAYADEDVLPRMARILGEGIGAERADVWLAVDQELRDVAAWPGDVRPPAPIAAAERVGAARSRASTACTRSCRRASCWARSRSASRRAIPSRRRTRS